MTAIIFILTAIAAVTAALFVVLHRSPVTSVLFLIAAFFCQAVLYLLLGAEFIAAVQVIVYTGAILVLFVFVLMLLDLRAAQMWERTGLMRRALGFAAAGALLVVAVRFLKGGVGFDAALAPGLGSTESVGQALFTRFLLPFEVLSLLLLAAIVGVVAMMKRGRPVEPIPTDEPEGGAQ